MSKSIGSNFGLHEVDPASRFALSVRSSPMFTQLPNRQPAARAERRRYQRHAVRCQCWLEGEELTLYGATADVGVGGLFLRTAIPVSMGSEVDVLLQVSREAGASDSADAVAARGVITRAVSAHPGARHGVGVEFLEIRRGGSALSELLNAYPALPWV